jgi:DNA anti-recombination protein RmuC
MEAKMDANQADQARMEAKLDANQAKATKQEEMLAEISARMDTNLNKMREEIKSSQAEMISTICAFQSELKETI